MVESGKISGCIRIRSIKITEKSTVNHVLAGNNELSVPVIILKKGFCLQNDEKKICGLGWIKSIPVILQKNEELFLPKHGEKKTRGLGWIRELSVPVRLLVLPQRPLPSGQE